MILPGIALGTGFCPEVELAPAVQRHITVLAHMCIQPFVLAKPARARLGRRPAELAEEIVVDGGKHARDSRRELCAEPAHCGFYRVFVHKLHMDGLLSAVHVACAHIPLGIFLLEAEDMCRLAGFLHRVGVCRQCFSLLDGV